jgi:hypothetical protein
MAEPSLFQKTGFQHLSPTLHQVAAESPMHSSSLGERLKASGLRANAEAAAVAAAHRVLVNYFPGQQTALDGFADAGIGCFNAKYHYGFWRPVTAIPAGGGNPDLTADPAWLPLGTTPNHPEYPVAHACITSAVSHLIAGYFGTSKVHIVVDSLAFKDGPHTHTFDDTGDFLDEVFWARVYAGFYYYRFLVDGRELGKKVAAQVERRYFRSDVDR